MLKNNVRVGTRVGKDLELLFLYKYILSLYINTIHVYCVSSFRQLGKSGWVGSCVWLFFILFLFSKFDLSV